MAEGRGTSNIIRAEGANHPSIISVGLEVKRDVCSELGDIIPVWGALSKKAKSVSACESVATHSAGQIFVCVSCDQGQHCSQECRAVVRCRQRREANRRYQQSERGKQSQRDRQRRYRERQVQACVTDQGGGTINSPAPRRSPTLCRCSICGRFSRWTDPFPPIPRQRRGWRDRWPVGESPKKYVFR